MNSLFLFFFPLIVPPSISDSLSSSDVIVREGANVSLTCHVDGYPKPDIKWKRDAGLQININKTLSGTCFIKVGRLLPDNREKGATEYTRRYTRHSYTAGPSTPGIVSNQMENLKNVRFNTILRV